MENVKQFLGGILSSKKKLSVAIFATFAIFIVVIATVLSFQSARQASEAIGDSCTVIDQRISNLRYELDALDLQTTSFIKSATPLKLTSGLDELQTGWINSALGPQSRDRIVSNIEGVFPGLVQDIRDRQRMPFDQSLKDVVLGNLIETKVVADTVFSPAFPANNGPLPLARFAPDVEPLQTYVWVKTALGPWAALEADDSEYVDVELASANCATTHPNLGTVAKDALDSAWVFGEIVADSLRCDDPDYIGMIGECASQDFVSPPVNEDAAQAESCDGELKISVFDFQVGECGFLTVKVFQHDSETGESVFLAWWTDSEGSERVGWFNSPNVVLGEGVETSIRVRVLGDRTYSSTNGEKTVLEFGVIY